MYTLYTYKCIYIYIYTILPAQGVAGVGAQPQEEGALSALGGNTTTTITTTTTTTTDNNNKCNNNTTNTNTNTNTNSNANINNNIVEEEGALGARGEAHVLHDAVLERTCTCMYVYIYIYIYIYRERERNILYSTL